MRVLDTLIDWHSEYPDNPPELQIVVAEFPPSEDLKYHQKGDTFYAKSSEGVLRFFHYIGPGNGNNGNDVTITLLNGDVKVLHGPWSSRTSVINSLQIGQYIDVTFIRKSDNRRRVLTMSIKKMMPHLERINATLKIASINKQTNEVAYIPWLPKQIKKNLKLSNVA